MKTAILGISAFYHDSAAALVIDGEIVAAAQEERFTRKKHDPAFPRNAVDYCLSEAKLDPEQLDYVGFYDKPILTYGRLLETYLAYAPRGFQSFLHAMPLWLKQKLHVPREIRKGLQDRYQKKIVFTEHHESHAASAFFPSPFEEAAILTLDGVGEWATASFGVGQGNQIHLTHQLRFPHSLGLLYSAFTYYCGFDVNSGEYKLMGLAPYGEPRFADLILEKLVDLKADGSFRMDMSYFNYCQGLTMTGPKFDELFDGPPHTSDKPLTQREMDIAASIQRVTEEIMLRIARHVHDVTGMKSLCLAGGCALNCVANGRILRETPFEDVWIQPAAGDAGGALGVALFVWHQLLKNDRTIRERDHQRGSFLGAEYSDEEIGLFLDEVGATYERMPDEDSLCDRASDAVAAGNVVGWYQGRMEFGPRALGARSILGDPRNPKMQSTINRKVKFREGFRPFAPIVLEEHAHEFFELNPGTESPYMLMVVPVQDEKRLPIPTELRRATGFDKLNQMRSVIPAVTHVDYSARVQTVDPKRHGVLRKLLERFYEKTNCPVMINTSFNLGWEPIVCSPQDAYATFMSCEIDVLCMAQFVLEKRAQPSYIKVGEDRGNSVALDDKLVSPCCRSSLAIEGSAATCRVCGHSFARTDGILQLYWPHEKIDDDGDVTADVREFYEDTPFPNYNDHDSLRVLIEKSRQGQYARQLDQALPFNSTILEVGCGTGQLTNFLGSACRQVVGTDMCLNSLKLGETFRVEQGLDRVRFIQMNLFRPVFEPATFDVILCNGVLHHTNDPRGGFEGLLPMLKPGGHVVIGLYNKYGRLFTDLRRVAFRITGGRAHWIDPVLRQKNLSDDRRRAWFADQYLHPHESKHTFGEVLEWFDTSGLEFIRGVPALTPDEDGLAGDSLFTPQRRGTPLEHMLVQASQVVARGQREGGFFVMIGRRPN